MDKLLSENSQHDTGSNLYLFFVASVGHHLNSAFSLVLGYMLLWESWCCDWLIDWGGMCQEGSIPVCTMLARVNRAQETKTQSLKKLHVVTLTYITLVHNVLLTEEVWATASGNMYKILNKLWTCGCSDMQAERHTGIMIVILHVHSVQMPNAFSALTLLIGQQEEHPARKMSDAANNIKCGLKQARKKRDRSSICQTLISRAHLSRLCVSSMCVFRSVSTFSSSLPRRSRHLVTWRVSCSTSVLLQHVVKTRVCYRITQLSPNILLWRTRPG